MPKGVPETIPDDGLTTRQRRNRPLLIVHTGAMVDGMLQVLDIYETRQQAEAFFDGSLHAALVQVLGAETLAAAPPPSRTYVETHDIIVR